MENTIPRVRNDFDELKLRAAAGGKFFMNPNSDPELSYSLDYEITKYKRIQKPGLNRLRITIIPRPKVSRAQRKVDRTVLKHVRR